MEDSYHVFDGVQIRQQKGRPLPNWVAVLGKFLACSSIFTVLNSSLLLLINWSPFPGFFLTRAGF